MTTTQINTETWSSVYQELRDAGFDETELEQRIVQSGETPWDIREQAKTDGRIET